jgi:hypothetical protein
MGKRKAGEQPGDLYAEKACQQCGKAVRVKAVPFGEPMALLLTGVCGHCYSTVIALDAMDGDVRVAALQLAEMFHQVGHTAHVRHH